MAGAWHRHGVGGPKVPPSSSGWDHAQAYRSGGVGTWAAKRVGLGSGALGVSASAGAWHTGSSPGNNNAWAQCSGWGNKSPCMLLGLGLGNVWHAAKPSKVKRQSPSRLGRQVLQLQVSSRFHAQFPKFCLGYRRYVSFINPARSRPVKKSCKGVKK